MKTYDKAPQEVHDRITALFARFYPDLKNVGLKVDVLMASTDSEEGHAVTHGGYPALAVVRVVGPKDRAKGCGDAEIVIDRDAYEAMDKPKRDALIDHELYHIELQRDRKDRVKLDDHRRPKLKLRKHDVQVGWFLEIARRHAEHSHEVRQATDIYRESGQLLFGFAQQHLPAVTDVTVRMPATGTGFRVDKDGIHKLGAGKKTVVPAETAVA